jgi:hypothetical protein
MPANKYNLPYFVCLSLIVHIAVVLSIGETGYLEFGPPVSIPVALNIILGDPEVLAKSGLAKPESARLHADSLAKNGKFIENGPSGFPSVANSPAKEEALDKVSAEMEAIRVNENISPDAASGVTARAVLDKGAKESLTDESDSVAVDKEMQKGPLHNSGEFLSSKREKLTYRISLLKIPVGTAIIEAINNGGELRITTRILSNSVLSTIYPVDDLVETRMIKGNYLLTRVRQKEGNYRGDFGFTLMLREHKAFWVDRIRNRYDYQPLPDENAMDVVSGLYYLRNLRMEVGTDISLPIFDSEEYALTQVEVERGERISLPGGNEVDTLVIHPLFKTAGFFRRTGDIRIWLTDDRFRVPVRLETFITLGKVTAELISAESEQ